ncbi:NADH-ubiquinone oxidoreductase-F iron-sulfur binding region domain-containing protein [Halorussus sp. AFM4]|uniref:NADH-ubiquinone oxidoreductase-F iron-sulfur binding region domain-containing protein n=1 Tax=Halorussus sp. AFM4 TaxID=3421651 RepID=UPI003EB815A1
MSPTADSGAPTLRVTNAGAPVADEVVRAARTAADDVRVVETGPTGIERLSPLALATVDGTTAFHANATTDTVAAVVPSLEAGQLHRNDADAVVDHDPATTRLPVPETGPLSVGRRRALGRCGWLDPTHPDADRETAGPVAGRVADDPDGALATLRTVGLRGRGRGDAVADDPVADAWETARDAAGDPVVVVNANEADPRARMDATLLEGDPAGVVDGALAVAAVVGATDVVFYVSETADLARRRVQAAATGPGDALGVDAALHVAVGPDEYTAGEPTMALESLEGADRIEARRRPPGPAEYGLYGRPTLVHTPRTLAQIRELLGDNDAGAFDPDASDPGTRVVTVTGDVDARATLELPTGGSLADALDAAEPTGRVKAACVGGRFGGLTTDLDVPPSAGALRGSDLGTNGVIEVCDEDTCVVALAGQRASFASAENCGRCYPGREGTKQLTGLLRDIYGGEYKDDMLRELTSVMASSSLCAFGRNAQRPARTAMDRFETEFVAHSRGRCPAGTCEVSAQAARSEGAGGGAD